MRHNDEEPGLLQLDRSELLADPFGEGRASAHEHRYVGAQRQAEFGQAVLAPVEFPQVIQAEQGGGRVGAAAADATAHGQALVQPDVGAQGAAGLLLQPARGADDQVAVVGDAGNVAVQADFAVLAQGEVQFVAVVEELEQRLQLVVAVGTAAEDVQEQVELGRGRQGQAGLHVIASLAGRADAAARP
ncbi:hypothetical protein FQZ97_601620 [compost metagenome]